MSKELFEQDVIFPCWKYHKTEEPRIFKSKEELKAAGAGWKDSPACFEKKHEAHTHEHKQEHESKEGEVTEKKSKKVKE